MKNQYSSALQYLQMDGHMCVEDESKFTVTPQPQFYRSIEKESRHTTRCIHYKHMWETRQQGMSVCFYNWQTRNKH